MCVAEKQFSNTDETKFREVVNLLQSVFHFEFHKILESLKDGYAPVNPERDTRRLTDKLRASPGFVSKLQKVLNDANYERLSDQDLMHAFDEASLFNLRLHVDLTEFDEVLLFTRGESTRRETVPKMFGLMSKQVEFTNYDRVVLYIKFSEKIKPNIYYTPGVTILKLFQNVPKADIEMLFPNTKLGMRIIDKLMIGIPAVIGGGVVLTTKVGTSLLLFGTLLGFYAGIYTEPVNLDQATLIALVAAFGALGSFLWKQFVNFKNRKLTFMQSLMESLYFKNLDNNAGVFHRLIDEAEEEECKEAILAYYFLLTRDSIQGQSLLDETIESWFQNSWQATVNFEIDDALAKLKGLGLVTEDADGLKAIPLDDAMTLLDKRWDSYFQYAEHESG